MGDELVGVTWVDGKATRGFLRAWTDGKGKGNLVRDDAIVFDEDVWIWISIRYDSIHRKRYMGYIPTQQFPSPTPSDPNSKPPCYSKPRTMQCIPSQSRFIKSSFTIKILQPSAVTSNRLSPPQSITPSPHFPLPKQASPPAHPNTPSSTSPS